MKNLLDRVGYQHYDGEVAGSSYTQIYTQYMDSITTTYRAILPKVYVALITSGVPR